MRQYEPDTAHAFFVGLARGATFRVAEMDAEIADMRHQRERTLTLWWTYSRTSLAQLSGCAVGGCYRCKPHDCPRHVAVEGFRLEQSNNAMLRRAAMSILLYAEAAMHFNGEAAVREFRSCVFYWHLDGILE